MLFSNQLIIYSILLHSEHLCKCYTASAIPQIWDEIHIWTEALMFLFYRQCGKNMKSLPSPQKWLLSVEFLLLSQCTDQPVESSMKVKMNILEILVQKGQTKGSNSSQFSTGTDSYPELNLSNAENVTQIWFLHLCSPCSKHLHNHLEYCERNIISAQTPWILWNPDQAGCWHNSHGCDSPGGATTSPSTWHEGGQNQQ